MRTARPALGLRLGRSGLTIFHRKIVRAALTLGSHLGRSPGKRSTGAFPDPAHPFTTASGARHVPSITSGCGR
jgi:hypothetical protein